MGKRMARTARTLSQIEAAWLGAMVEGEGTYDIAVIWCLSST